MNNAICPCVFIKKSSSGFVIIAVYVDDLNIIGTQKEVDDARTHMKEEFEMKDLGKTKFYLRHQIEHLRERVFVHQSNYTKKVIETLLYGQINSFEYSDGTYINKYFGDANGNKAYESLYIL